MPNELNTSIVDSNLRKLASLANSKNVKHETGQGGPRRQSPVLSHSDRCEIASQGFVRNFCGQGRPGLPADGCWPGRQPGSRFSMGDWENRPS